MIVFFPPFVRHFCVCCCLFLFVRISFGLLVLSCPLFKFEWLFESFHALTFLSIDVQVDSVMLFISYLSFVILLCFVCSVLIPCPYLLLLLSALIGVLFVTPYFCNFIMTSVLCNAIFLLFDYDVSVM